MSVDECSSLLPFRQPRQAEFSRHFHRLTEAPPLRSSQVPSKQALREKTTKRRHPHFAW